MSQQTCHTLPWQQSPLRAEDSHSNNNSRLNSTSEALRSNLSKPNLLRWHERLNNMTKDYRQEYFRFKSHFWEKSASEQLSQIQRNAAFTWNEIHASYLSKNVFKHQTLPPPVQEATLKYFCHHRAIVTFRFEDNIFYIFLRLEG